MHAYKQLDTALLRGQARARVGIEHLKHRKGAEEQNTVYTHTLIADMLYNQIIDMIYLLLLYAKLVSS